MKKHLFVHGADPLHGGLATICWLFDHGANVTVTGMRDTAERSALAKRIDDHFKRIARDGKEYDALKSRLSWIPGKYPDIVDVQELFVSTWHKKIIGITGLHGKTMTAVWAGHLIGDAVVAGHLPERPLMAAADSHANIAVIELHGNIPEKVHAVSTDGKQNIDTAIEVAKLAGVSDKQIQHRLSSLPQVPFRQEIMKRSTRLTIVNDAMASVPERGIVAVQRFGGPTCALISGGEGEIYDYCMWADAVKTKIRPTNLVLIEGTATKNIRAALGVWGRGIRAYETLDAAVRAAQKRAALFVSATVLFSPAAHIRYGALTLLIK